jgi:hypothetical protein
MKSAKVLRRVIKLSQNKCHIVAVELKGSMSAAKACSVVGKMKQESIIFEIKNMK